MGQGRSNLDGEYSEYASTLIKLYQSLTARNPGSELDKRTFLSYFDYPGVFGERVFALFDKEGRGKICMKRFIGGVTSYLDASTDEKLAILFKIYDQNGKNAISYADFAMMLYSLIHIPAFIPGGLDLVKQCQNKQDALRKTMSNGNDDHFKSGPGPPGHNGHNGHNASAHSGPAASSTENHKSTPLRKTLSTSSVAARYATGAADCQQAMVDKIALQAFGSCELKQTDALSFEQFKKWVTKSPEVLRALEQSFAKHMWDRPGLPAPTSAPSTQGSLQESFDNLALPDEPFGGNDTLVRNWITTPKSWELCDELFCRFTDCDCSGVRPENSRLEKRCYCLRDNFLYVFPPSQVAKEGAKPEAIIWIEGLFIDPVPDQEQPGLFGLVIKSASCSHNLYATSLELRERWVSALRVAAKTVPLEAEYTLGKQIGYGRFARVYAAKHNRTGDEYAVKVIAKHHVSVTEMENLRAELAILKVMCHPHVISMTEVFESPDNLQIVMPLVPGGDLHDRIRELRRFSEDVARTIMGQLLSALQYLHARGVVHRDVKPENILVLELSKHKQHVMIADFGLSQFATAEQTMEIICGTLAYLAPEVLMCRGYTRAVDVWGAGIVCYFMLAGVLPFNAKTRGELIDEIIANTVSFESRVWTHISDQAKDLINKLLCKDPEQRISLDQALKHPWFSLELRNGVRKKRQSVGDGGVLDRSFSLSHSQSHSHSYLSLSGDSSLLAVSAAEWKDPSLALSLKARALFLANAAAAPSSLPATTTASPPSSLPTTTTASPRQRRLNPSDQGAGPLDSLQTQPPHGKSELQGPGSASNSTHGRSSRVSPVRALQLSPRSDAAVGPELAPRGCSNIVDSSFFQRENVLRDNNNGTKGLKSNSTLEEDDSSEGSRGSQSWAEPTGPRREAALKQLDKTIKQYEAQLVDHASRPPVQSRDLSELEYDEAEWQEHAWR